MNSHKWKEFDFVDIFDIRKGFYNKKPPCYKDGNIPFIGATESNNGITGFSDHPTIEANSKLGYGSNENINRKLFPGNAICVTNNGSVGYAYYQPSEFTCTHDVNPLYLKPTTLNQHLAMFLITCIEKQRICFTYARKWRPKRMVHSKIMLPTNSTNTPDWMFMENFMRQKEQQILRPIIDRLSKPVACNQTHMHHNILNHKWEAFDFTDIFTDIQRGKRLKKANHTEGNTPYISSTSQSNGVDGFIGNQSSVRTFADCLTVANSGSVGSTFYHLYRFVASDHVTRLQREGLDKYSYLFMVPIINRLSEKYSFNREINDDRIKREKILLPVNNKGEIDFTFMSAFMRDVEGDILSTTLRYFKKKQ